MINKFKLDKKYEPKLEEFASQMFDCYKKSSDINRIFKIKDYINEKDKEFRQMAQWVKLPKEIFIKEEGIHKNNSFLADDFVRSITYGEREFFIKSILDSQSNIIEMDRFDLNKILLEAESVRATDIFFSLDFYQEFFLWVNANPKRIEFGYYGESVIDKKLTIHKIPSDFLKNKIIILDRNKLNMIQKRVNGSDSPKEIKNKIDFFNKFKDEKLMLYLGNSDEKYFDFIFKTVLSKPRVYPNSIVVLEVKEEQKEVSE